MRIDESTWKNITEYRISSNVAEFTLSVLTDSKDAPEEYGLYIWSLPFGSRGTEILEDAIKEITGSSRIKEIRYSAYNGHGSVKVIYL